MTPEMTSQDPRLYIRVLCHVRQQIENGTLNPGEPIQTITSLCREFSCTRQTVAKALRMLTDEGLLTRYPGLGYYATRDD